MSKMKKNIRYTNNYLCNEENKYEEEEEKEKKGKVIEDS